MLSAIGILLSTVVSLPCTAYLYAASRSLYQTSGSLKTVNHFSRHFDDRINLLNIQVASNTGDVSLPRHEVHIFITKPSLVPFVFRGSKKMLIIPVVQVSDTRNSAHAGPQRTKAGKPKNINHVKTEFK